MMVVVVIIMMMVMMMMINNNMEKQLRKMSPCHPLCDSTHGHMGKYACAHMHIL